MAVITRGSLRGMSQFSYSDENSVRAKVAMVLEDVAAALRSHLPKGFELTFVVDILTFGDKADLWVIRSHGIPVGAVEVKKPGKGAMTKPNILGECYDYMQGLRGFYGLEHVFCILTSYLEWRILWLPDTDDAARSMEMPTMPPFVLNKEEMLNQLLGNNVFPPWPGTYAAPIQLEGEARSEGLAKFRQYQKDKKDHDDIASL